MATTARIFYLLTTALAGHGGTNLRNLNEPGQQTTLVETSICDFGADTTTGNIVVNPVNTRATRETITAGKGMGWALDRTTMGATATAERRLLGGTWTFLVYAKTSLLHVGGEATTLTVVVHRVSATNVYTEVFRASNTIALALTYALVTITATGQAEVDLLTDETLLLEYWMTDFGIAVTGRMNTFGLGDTDAVTAGSQEPELDVPTPGVRTLYLRTVAVTMASAVSIVRRISVGLASFPGVTMTGVVSLVRGLTLRRTLAVTMTGAAALTRLLTLGRTLAVTMVGVASGLLQVPFAKVPNAVVQAIRVVYSRLRRGKR